MDEYDEQPSFRTEQFVLPTAPRAARGPDVSDDRIPRDPVINLKASLSRSTNAAMEYTVRAIKITFIVD